MARHTHDSWREAMRFISHCPICNTAYNQDLARLFAEHHNARLVHVTCPSCASNFIAMVMVMSHGLSSVGMITDLSFADAERLFGTEPITTDEVISGYQQLHSEQFLFT